ncbi:polymer-forming cytoskeletal protein [bacterium]|nr:polymer-forming cytoskeletal protein [bacterium]
MKKSKNSESEITAFIGQGAVLKGTLSFEGTVRIDGNLEGEITSSGNLIVGPDAVVEADITIGSIYVSGKIVGSVHAKDQIVLHNTAKVYGNLFTPSLIMAEGVFFQGNCQMEENIKTIPLLELPEKAALAE